MNDPTAVSAVCITVTDEHAMSAYVHGDSPEGSVFVGERIQFAGTPERLRSLAKAIEDGAMELERQIADRRYVSPLGDRRERPVPCSGCYRQTFALDRRCDECAEAVAS